MGLSNYVPNSRISQAGVVDNTADRPASPYEGQVLYQRDTNQLLVWDGSAWVMIADTDAPPALQLIKTQTVGTGVSSVPVENVFSSEFDSYRIIFIGTSGSTDINLGIQLGPSSVSGYNDEYYFILNYSLYNGTSNNNIANINDGTSWPYVGNASTSHSFLSCDIFGPYLSRWTTIGTAPYVTPSNAGFSSGLHKSTASFTGFTILPSTGTITGGTIRVYGYRN